jgi:hypothetical protein
VESCFSSPVQSLAVVLLKTIPLRVIQCDLSSASKFHKSTLSLEDAGLLEEPPRCLSFPLFMSSAYQVWCNPITTSGKLSKVKKYKKLDKEDQKKDDRYCSFWKLLDQWGVRLFPGLRQLLRHTVLPLVRKRSAMERCRRDSEQYQQPSSMREHLLRHSVPLELLRPLQHQQQVRTQ